MHSLIFLISNFKLFSILLIHFPDVSGQYDFIALLWAYLPHHRYLIPPLHHGVSTKIQEAFPAVFVTFIISFARFLSNTLRKSTTRYQRHLSKGSKEDRSGWRCVRSPVIRAPLKTPSG